MKINKYLEAKELTVDQVEKVAEWVKKSKEVGLNIDYGFAANPNIETYEELAISKWKDALYFGTTDKDFSDWLIEETPRTEEVKEKTEYETEAEEVFAEFETTGDSMEDTISFRKFAASVMSEVSRENKKRYGAYREAESKKRKGLRSKVAKNMTGSTSSGVTGPIYDDDSKPTYFDLGKGE